MHASLLALYFVFIQFSLLVPGYTLIRKSGLLRQAPGIQLCLGYVCSMALFALFATLDYAFKLSPELTRGLCWVLIVGSTALFLRERYYKPLMAFRFPLLCLLAMNVLSLAFIGLRFNAPYTIIPDPAVLPARNYQVFDVKILNVAQTQANDNYIPYRQAQFFVNRSNPATDSFISEWGVSFFERTPLMGAVVANYFNLFDDKPPIAYTWSDAGQDPDHTFIKFQVIAQILNGLLILPGFFLLAQLLNRKTALVTSLFLVTSQFFVYNAFFSWPKSLVAFFILTSLLLLLRGGRTNTVLAGLISGIAYLTHDLAVIYIGASFIYLLYKRRFRDVGLFALPSLVFAAPWLLVASLKYHKPSTFIYYPFSTQGIPAAGQGQAIFHRFFHTSPITLIYIRLRSVFYLLSPYQLLNSGGGQSLERRLWALGLFSIPGALGIGLIVPAYIGLAKLARRSWPAIFILLPVVLCTLLIGWPEGLGALHFAESVVVLWSGISVYWLLSLKRVVWVLVSYVVNVAQFVFFTLYSYDFRTGAWLHSAHSLLAMAAMAVIIIGCGLAVYAVATDNKKLLSIRMLTQRA